MARTRRSAGDVTRARIIAAFERAPELPPTYQELAHELGLQVNTIHHHVTILVEAGILMRIPRIARGIRLAPSYLPSGTTADPPVADPPALSTDAAIVDFIRRRAAAGEHRPTTGELAVALRLSKSTIRRHLKALRDAGTLQYQDRFRQGVRREWYVVENGVID